MITEADKAWLAGIVDCAARPYFYQDKKFIIIYGLKDDVVQERANKLIGSAPSRVVYPSGQWDRKQCAEHCPERHVHVVVGGPRKEFNIGRHQALIILPGLAPYSAIPGKYAEWVEQMTPRNNGANIPWTVADRMRYAGWDIPVSIDPRNCKVHGPEHIREYKQKRDGGYKIRLRCKLCQDERHAKWMADHPDYEKQRNRSRRRR
jgi:hypothetical protein